MVVEVEIRASQQKSQANVMMGTAALGDAELRGGEQRVRLATSLEYWE